MYASISRILCIISMVCITSVSTQAAGVHIVGSSTVYPFAKRTADYLLKNKMLEHPIHFDVTGSGSGIKLFCASNAPASPDITNASRRIKPQELEDCQKHGVHVTEMMMGYDGIVIVQSDASLPLHLSTKSLFLALAKKVPSKDGKKLIPNPYNYWDDINSGYPHREILIFGPPKHAGTRDILESKVMGIASREMKLYRAFPKNEYHTMREDGRFISDGENHTRDVSILLNNHDAIAVFGYSYYYHNHTGLNLISFNHISPNPENIASMHYPLARPLFFYIKNGHLSNNKDLNTYIHTIMSDMMIGDSGILVNAGLIPLPGSVRGGYRLWLKYGFELKRGTLSIEAQ